MPSFFESLADKAQSAINASPLAGHIPSSFQGHGNADQPSANEAAAQGGIGAKSQVLGNLQHQFRSLQMQYSTTSPVQKIITTQKGVALDFDSVSRDSKSQSRELYMWGQNEDDDIKDVTDRLAYLNFVHGALAEKLSRTLDSSRTAFKALRDAENNLTPRRNIRAGIQNQLSRIEHDQQKGMEKRVAELKQQLRKAEADDDPLERDLEILKRKAIRDGEEAKWAAIREYGEKLVLLSQASTSIISALPSVPPTAAQPYSGAQMTATTRAALQKTLDNYKLGSISHVFQPTAADLNRSDSRSFGVTHASELSSIASGTGSSTSNVPVTPPPTTQSAAPSTPPKGTTLYDNPVPQSKPAPVPVPTAGSADSTGSLASAPSPGFESPPVNPAALNNAPAPVPKNGSNNASGDVSAQVLHLSPQHSSAPLPSDEGPTVAETGVPLSAGAGGPGPSSGSILDLKAGSPTKSSSPPAPGYGQSAPQYGSFGQTGGAPGYGAGATTHESAEDEKKRLEREERERVLRAGAPPSAFKAPTGTSGPQYESAEDEKKRLEREEREKILSQGGSGGGGDKDGSQGGDNTGPPPYQDF